MQARPKIVKILVVALLVSLVLAACGGGSTGKTWFNLPSAKVHVQPDGSMRLWGLTVGYFPQPALIQQLQAANIQQLEVRTGYNGIHVYANGEDLPYIKWDEASVQTLQDILPKLPNVPNASTIASALPWLRTIGLGLRLDMPLADGQSRLDIPRWSGETAITPSTAVTSTLGPLTIGSLTFDEQGQAIIEGVPAATLQSALGGIALPSLDANTLGILQNIGVEKVIVHLFGNGIDLTLNDKPLPGVAWDDARLNTLLADVPAFVPDQGTVAMLNQVVPVVKGADVTVAIGFKGEQAADTVLTPVELSVNENGDVSLAGIPLAPGAIPADALANLQKANVQQLDLSLQPTGLTVAANGQTLPTVTWTPESLQVIAKVVGPMAGGTDLINTVLPMVLGLGPNVKLHLPPAAGAAPVEIPAEVAAIRPISATADAPNIKLGAGIDAGGNLTSIGGFTADEIAQLGVTLPALPVDSLTALRDAGVKQVVLDTEPGKLNILLDGSNAVTINYDDASIATTLDIATPFLGDSPITEPVLNGLLRSQIIPMILTSNVDLTIDLQ